ncbi:hypothetical protein EDEG_00705 [Edhazardia aedis USNM 41457]|uniref:Small ribosomal subunit protein uS10 domain-containing protein n=1 Tax=Edhazardia aedis (strain USNM 41457) TaxID=1003232 RepID=J9DRP6_EDHAE|nr:hypothetical protein EDEG_00705 [Edhazardia aedis USNM 41457]|eukprot:EJW05240.1 hypothetical protein EDEG_00705 [Edhazardia aedis USNM 41457]
MIAADDKPYDIEEFTPQAELQVMIKISSVNKTIIDNVCQDLNAFLKNTVSSAVSFKPQKTEIAKITTRKSPCGEGTNTWARYKLRVYVRVFEFSVNHEMLGNIADFLKHSNVEIVLTIKN